MAISCCVQEQKSQGSVFFRTKNEYKDFYSIQQGVLLLFINGYCSITLKKQKKQAKVTSALPVLETLQFDDDAIDVQELANAVFRPVYMNELQYIPKKQTVVRRFEKNKKVFVQHLLIDILVEKGFFFESKFARNTKKTARLERIETIYYGGRVVMQFEEFIKRGYAINNFINGLFGAGTTVVIPKNYPPLANLLLQE